MLVKIILINLLTFCLLNYENNCIGKYSHVFIDLSLIIYFIFIWATTREDMIHYFSLPFYREDKIY